MLNPPLFSEATYRPKNLDSHTGVLRIKTPSFNKRTPTFLGEISQNNKRTPTDSARSAGKFWTFLVKLTSKNQVKILLKLTLCVPVSA